MPTGLIAIETAAAQPLAAAIATVPAGAVGAHFRPHLDRVYAFLRGRPELRFPGAHNVFVYRSAPAGGTLAVAFGVQVREAFAPEGDILSTATPAGRIAAAVHIGPYDRMRETQQAIQQWCHANGLALAGANWEIYGDWTDDPTKLETKLCYLLR